MKAQIRIDPAVIFVRADLALKSALEQAARENGRTLNAEVVRRLRASLETYRNF